MSVPLIYVFFYGFCESCVLIIHLEGYTLLFNTIVTIAAMVIVKVLWHVCRYKNIVNVLCVFVYFLLFFIYVDNLRTQLFNVIIMLFLG